jgi:hypothetical protein
MHKIPETLLNQMKCCSSTDGHITIEPVLLRCGGNICKQCIIESDKRFINCFECHGKHKRKHVLESPNNKIVETMVHSFLNDLFQYVDSIFKETTDGLKERSMIKDINEKIREIENEMDLRVQSLVAAIHEYRDECKLELENYKQEIEK